MANAGCINAIGFDGTFLRTLQTLDSANIGVGVQFCAPNPLDDKRLDYIKYTDKCGCTCCLSGENEILIYATQGVIKNFTLTNDDTNEVVNVKWNDLFGSNRAYTMVRYKTGSYPTSITDGTLAVKETTQNQYATSGYNVSGLTDGTRYYFTAFAVSQDGTIIVMQSKNITTDFGRPITATTLLYMQLNGNVLDKSNNHYNGTAYGITYSAGGRGQVANFSGTSTYITTPDVGSFANDRTIMFFVKLGSTNGHPSNVSKGTAEGTRKLLQIGFIKSGDTNGRNPAIGFYGDDMNSGIAQTTDERAFYCFTYEYSTRTRKIYKNCVLQTSGTSSGQYDIGTGGFTIGRRAVNNVNARFSGQMAELIIENKIVAESTMQSFFNNTKGKFGMS